MRGVSWPTWIVALAIVAAGIWLAVRSAVLAWELGFFDWLQQWAFVAFLFAVNSVGWLGVVYRWPWEPGKVEPRRDAMQFELNENGEYWRV